MDPLVSGSSPQKEKPKEKETSPSPLTPVKSDTQTSVTPPANNRPRRALSRPYLEKRREIRKPEYRRRDRSLPLSAVRNRTLSPVRTHEQGSPDAKWGRQRTETCPDTQSENQQQQQQQQPRRASRPKLVHMKTVDDSDVIEKQVVGRIPEEQIVRRFHEESPFRGLARVQDFSADTSKGGTSSADVKDAESFDRRRLAASSWQFPRHTADDTQCSQRIPLLEPDSDDEENNVASLVLGGCNPLSQLPCENRRENGFVVKPLVLEETELSISVCSPSSDVTRRQDLFVLPFVVTDV
ncbi:hypothetical protein BaRGS_00032669 [Batillaria attramentaria]|uniref:Uncharacterized protein n=1 Tax=Batillaria attramentaria TaxID=370345 RepID=A0ABD0JNK9_9CAEN